MDIVGGINLILDATISVPRSYIMALHSKNEPRTFFKGFGPNQHTLIQSPSWRTLGKIHFYGK